MSIKSTKIITREQAEKLYVSFKMERLEKHLRKNFEEELLNMNDERLGDTLDEITTCKFSNYLIQEEAE